jgi:wobble nucleotide-excising tRNase
LIFAHNAVGKTRLSGEYKDIAKREGKADTLYYNAFTEDLFTWNNDIKKDVKRYLRINKKSSLFAGIEAQDLNGKVRPLVYRYADFILEIIQEKWRVKFTREVLIDGTVQEKEFIKVSRGEQNIFVWCFFLAIMEMALDEDIELYNDVKNIYIDDPISSLDENNAVTLACHLAEYIKDKNNKKRFVISTHHSLFFNVMFNELGNKKTDSLYLHRNKDGKYKLSGINDTPFFQHVALLSELNEVALSDSIKPYHFNALRSVMEKTSSFLGLKSFDDCINESQEKANFKRILHLYSHGKYSVFDPVIMDTETKDSFKRVLSAFINDHGFVLTNFEAATR